MDNYKIAICDDEVVCCNELCDILNEYERYNNLIFEIKCYEDGNKLVSEKLSDFDMFFLDIEMDCINGIDTAKFIIRECPDAIIMFVTGFDNYIDFAFDLKVMRYLNKPVDKDRLFRALNIVIMDINKEKQYISVRDYRGQLCEIKIIDIIRVFIDGRKVSLETSDNIYETNKSFSEMEKILENFDFVHTYRKRLANLLYVSGFEDDKLLLKKGNQEIEEYINTKLIGNVRKEWMLYGRKFR
jgi:DNA-binding LytR/AlgR family response regulator